jgi:hypothetical protein
MRNSAVGLLVLLASAGAAWADSAAVNTIPQHEGYGAANAGGAGKLPQGPMPKSSQGEAQGKPGQGVISGAGGKSTGAAAATSTEGEGTGDTAGAGSH